MIRLKDKRAAEMTIGTIIIIILALVVLVFLIFGFTRGTGNLFENIRNFFGGGANVQTVVTGCQTACATNSVYDWCRYRDVKFEEGGVAQSKSCADLVSMPVGLDACPGITTASCKGCRGNSTCAKLDKITCTAGTGCTFVE